MDRAGTAAAPITVEASRASGRSSTPAAATAGDLLDRRVLPLPRLHDPGLARQRRRQRRHLRPPHRDLRQRDHERQRPGRSTAPRRATTRRSSATGSTTTARASSTRATGSTCRATTTWSRTTSSTTTRRASGSRSTTRALRAIVAGNTITGAGHSGIVVGGSGGVSGVRVHNNVLAFNALVRDLPRRSAARRARSPTTTSPSATAAARPRRAAPASTSGGNRNDRPAVRQLRSPEHAPGRG